MTRTRMWIRTLALTGGPLSWVVAGVAAVAAPAVAGEPRSIPPGGAAPAATRPSAGAEPKTPAERMEREAAEVLRLLQQQWDVGGVPLTPEFLAAQCEWSRKLALAVRMSSDGPHRVKVLEEHLDRVRRAHELLETRWAKGLDPMTAPSHMAAYYAAEAEMWLTEAKAGGAAQAGAAPRPASPK